MDNKEEITLRCPSHGVRYSGPPLEQLPDGRKTQCSYPLGDKLYCLEFLE